MREQAPSLAIIALLFMFYLFIVDCGGKSGGPRPEPPAPNPQFCNGSRPMNEAEKALCRKTRDCLLGAGFAIHPTIRNTEPYIIIQPAIACGNGIKGCCITPISPAHAGWGPIGSEFVPECNPDVAKIGSPAGNKQCNQAYWNNALEHECGHWYGLDQNHQGPLWNSCGLMR